MSNLVDYVPFLRNFPRFTMINRAKKLHEDLRDTVNTLIKNIDKRMQAGEDVADCLATYLLSIRKEEDLDDLDITFICCAFMIGGVESVSRYEFPYQASLTLAFVRALPSYSGSSRSFLRTLQSKNALTMSSTV